MFPREQQIGVHTKHALCSCSHPSSGALFLPEHSSGMSMIITALAPASWQCRTLLVSVRVSILKLATAELQIAPSLTLEHGNLLYNQRHVTTVDEADLSSDVGVVADVRRPIVWNGVGKASSDVVLWAVEMAIPRNHERPGNGRVWTICSVVLCLSRARVSTLDEKSPSSPHLPLSLPSSFP